MQLYENFTIARLEFAWLDEMKMAKIMIVRHVGIKTQLVLSNIIASCNEKMSHLVFL
jgi:hypothetical protein